MIKKLLTYTFIIECIFCTKAHATEIGAWNNYMAYYEIQQIKAAGNDIFVLASNNLYMYNTNDGSITTYDKIKGLTQRQQYQTYCMEQFGKETYSRICQL